MTQCTVEMIMPQLAALVASVLPFVTSLYCIVFHSKHIMTVSIQHFVLKVVIFCLGIFVTERITNHGASLSLKCAGDFSNSLTCVHYGQCRCVHIGRKVCIASNSFLRILGHQHKN